jgi:hypothetical protein
MLRGLKVENGVETLVDEVGIKRSGLNPPLIYHYKLGLSIF